MIVLLLKTVLNDQMLYNIIYYGKLYYENVIIRKNGLVLKEELLRPHAFIQFSKVIKLHTTLKIPSSTFSLARGFDLVLSSGVMTPLVTPVMGIS